MNTVRILVSVALVNLLAATLVSGDEPMTTWPQEIAAREWIVTMYQPQIDSFEQNTLEARAAVSVKRADGSGEPAFGAVWISAKLDIDREDRLVVVREVEVSEVRFADSEEADREALARLLRNEMPNWEITMDLDQIIADVEIDGEFGTTAGLRSDAPRFVHSTEPAVLLLFDGEPKTQAIAGADGFERVVNTPFPVVRQKSGSSFYLFGGDDYWYVAWHPKGPWEPTSDVPQGIRDLTREVAAPEEFEAGDEDSQVPPPKIVVATEPTELIVTQGEPMWAPVEDLDLLYLDNSDSDVFLDLSTQKYYVLAAGRWFAGTALERQFTWDNVPNDELPESFAAIPADSVNGHIPAHVAGTEEAREEALQNTIPQTAAVRRDDTSFAVSYDGEPDFKPVDELPEVRYAVNTTVSVFIANGKYWACDNAIWYTASQPTGPWSVATEIPASLYRIPASNPHHNVTYVKVYETTPQVVYVGYTPGYLGSYWYRGCVVWGTGWHYNPWHGPHYYPRPWTWGLNVRYNPWYGWSFGVSWSNGPFQFSYRWGGGHRHPWYGPGWGGWFGPGGYKPPYYRPYPPPGYRKPRPSPYGGGTRAAQLPAGARPMTRPSNNIYNRPTTRDKVVSTPSTRDRVRPTSLESPNNVFTDRSGNVYRPGQGSGWESRQNGSWKSAEGLDRPTTRPSQPAVPAPLPAQPTTRPTQPSTRPTPSTRPSSPGATRPQLERDYRSRQRGSQRVQRRPPTPSRSMAGPSPTRR